MDVDAAIRNFRECLVAGYPAWRKAAAAALEQNRGYLDEAFDDWAQSQWELLVERVVLGPEDFLEVYGSGSDYEMQIYSRVFFYEAQPTYDIFVESTRDGCEQDLLSGSGLDPSRLQFDRFVSYRDGHYEDSPPFDYVLLVTRKGNEPHLVRLSGVRFSMRRLVGA
jgi:hypothetical protein